MHRHDRYFRGVTLIEVIVGVLLIIVALTLILPMIVEARGQARVHAVKNNLRNVGVALHNYHDVYRTFPTQPKSQD
jgi:type II secretory pathway pseudopilin PulG